MTHLTSSYTTQLPASAFLFSSLASTINLATSHLSSPSYGQVLIEKGLVLVTLYPGHQHAEHGLKGTVKGVTSGGCQKDTE